MSHSDKTIEAIFFLDIEQSKAFLRSLHADYVVGMDAERSRKVVVDPVIFVNMNFPDAPTRVVIQNNHGTEIGNLTDIGLLYVRDRIAHLGDVSRALGSRGLTVGQDQEFFPDKYAAAEEEGQADLGL